MSKDEFSIPKYFKFLIEECYEEDYNPYTAQTWQDNYCYNMTFSKWYFRYRSRIIYDYRRKNKFQYFHTPEQFIIGGEIFTNTHFI